MLFTYLNGDSSTRECLCFDLEPGSLGYLFIEFTDFLLGISLRSFLDVGFTITIASEFDSSDSEAS